MLVISSNLEEEGLDGLRAARRRAKISWQRRCWMPSKRETVLERFLLRSRKSSPGEESIETLGKCVRSVYQGQIWANSEQIWPSQWRPLPVRLWCAVNVNGLSESMTGIVGGSALSGGRPYQPADC